MASFLDIFKRNFSLFSSDIGIDLGTATVLVYVKGKGIVLNEPSVVAVNKVTGKLVAVGTEAQETLGRTPDNIIAIRPLREGVISDYEMTELMIKEFIRKVQGFRLFKPNVVICVPSIITEVEERAVIDAGTQAGAKRVFLIEEPVAAAIGAGLDISRPNGNLVADIGGGTTDIAVISLGGIVTSSSLRLAGNRLDEAIAMHLRDLLGIKIGERTAEVIKIKIGSILPFEDGRERDMIISGQDVYTEQPKEVTIQSEDVRAALQAPIEEMVLHIKDTFKKTNPDLASDIIQNGILLTGGGGLLSGLDRYLTDKLEIPVWVSETALTNVVSGCLKVLETPTALKQTLMRSK